MTPIAAESEGTSADLVITVTEDMSADAYGNEGLPALATPAVVGLFERAAMRAVASLLGPGERSVGSAVEIVHRAPTPLGAEVVVTATIASVDGREVWFDVRAHEGETLIADGRHSRFVVDDARFQQRLAPAA